MKQLKQYYIPILQALKRYSQHPNQRIALVIGMLPWHAYVGKWVLEDSHVQIQRHFHKRYFQFFLKPLLNGLIRLFIFGVIKHQTSLSIMLVRKI